MGGRKAARLSLAVPMAICGVYPSGIPVEAVRLSERGNQWEAQPHLAKPRKKSTPPTARTIREPLVAMTTPTTSTAAMMIQASKAT